MATVSAPHRPFEMPAGLAPSGLDVRMLGGLFELGGAEFRLSLLTARFGFVALEAVISNNAPNLLFGAWWSASRDARRMTAPHAAIAATLVLNHALPADGAPGLEGGARWPAGVAVGFGLGSEASLPGVVGGESPIATIVLLFRTDSTLAGSLLLAVSLPAMLVGFARYNLGGNFTMLGSLPWRPVPSWAC